MNFCSIPPYGWLCTRDPGHEGPCAAHPLKGKKKLDPTNPKDPLDPGIEKTVLFLREHGFETVDSGDGKTKIENGYNTEGDPRQDAWAFPHVIMEVDVSEAFQETHRLLTLMRSIGIDIKQEQIQLTYGPIDKTATLLLSDVTL